MRTVTRGSAEIFSIVSIWLRLLVRRFAGRIVRACPELLAPPRFQPGRGTPSITLPPNAAPGCVGTILVSSNPARSNSDWNSAFERVRPPVFTSTLTSLVLNVADRPQKQIMERRLAQRCQATGGDFFKVVPSGGLFAILRNLCEEIVELALAERMARRLVRPTSVRLLLPLQAPFCHATVPTASASRSDRSRTSRDSLPADTLTICEASGRSDPGPNDRADLKVEDDFLKPIKPAMLKVKDAGRSRAPTAKRWRIIAIVDYRTRQEFADWTKTPLSS